MNTHQIGKYAEALRKSKGITQVVACQMAGVDQGSLSRLESGQRMPTVDILARLANAYGVELAEFFGDAPKELTADEVALLDAYRCGDFARLIRVAARRAEEWGKR